MAFCAVMPGWALEAVAADTASGYENDSVVKRQTLPWSQPVVLLDSSIRQ
ncbi:MAG TPA: hypothetical protein VLI39_14095 [Sedimentisphaerales bacterium]|nr:hypothetical protein [Sedimentisphaerales bacterium]